jgi:hypothetical protein
VGKETGAIQTQCEWLKAEIQKRSAAQKPNPRAKAKPGKYVAQTPLGNRFIFFRMAFGPFSKFGVQDSDQ